MGKLLTGPVQQGVKQILLEFQVKNAAFKLSPKENGATS